VRLTVLPDAEGAARHVAGLLAGHVAAARTRAAALHVALAGGTTPLRAYALLGAAGGDWSHVHLWLGDERCVPAGHPDANERAVREALVDPLAAAGGAPRLHGARGELGPEDAAWLYAADLVAALGPVPVLDVALLGLGEDGHTASLFPGHPAAGVRHAPVAAVRGAPKPPPERVTLTPPVLAGARCTVLLATGAGKREALARVRAADPAVPAGRLAGALDEVVCDGAAAGGPAPRS
jgi:6-phosphogluconolactonase